MFDTHTANIPEDLKLLRKNGHISKLSFEKMEVVFGAFNTNVLRSLSYPFTLALSQVIYRVNDERY